MKIAIYGAAGMVGSEITQEAVRRGHETVAITRTGTPVEGSTSLSADISDLPTFQKITDHSDVVVISVPPPRDGGAHEALITAHKNILKIEPSTRLFVVGGAGALHVGRDRFLKDVPDFPAAFKPEAETMTKVLELYNAATKTDWTMLAPAPDIAPGPRTGEYTIGRDEPVGASITTPDFAIAVLDEIESPQHIRSRFTVAN